MPLASEIAQNPSTAADDVPAVTEAPPVKPSQQVGLGKHYARYSAATVLIMLAGLVSFPTLTRLLDNTQYGILGYYETWILMTFAVTKLGAQHAILRMYPFGGDESRLRHFATNLVYLPLMVSLGLWLAGMIVFAGGSWALGAVHSPVLWLALLAIPMMVFVSQVEMTLRASERSGLLTTTKVSARWMELALVLTAVIAIERSALAVYGGRIVSLTIVVLFYIRWVRQHLHFSRDAIDYSAYRDSLLYGLPLVANEVAGTALVSLDRVMLKHMTGDYAAVGIYTIGCALAMQLGVLVNNPFWDSVTPVLNRTYTIDGVEAVRELKSRLLLPVTYASVGVAVGIWAAGADVLQMLSGPSKVASGTVFAWVGTVYAIMLVLDLSGYGLLLRKRTGRVMTLMVLAMLLNIVLNLLWIPDYGYMGAVYATVVSYLLLGLGRCLLCPKGLFQGPDKRTLWVSLFCATVFLLAAHFSGVHQLGAPWERAFAMGGLWVVCYAVLALMLDRRLRYLLSHWRAEMRLGARG